jgi:hypothetical protein
MTPQIRKVCLSIEDTAREADEVLEPVLRKVACAAVIRNPFAGRFVEDLSALFEVGEKLGELLAKRAVAALGTSRAHSYGKAAIVGTDGDLEHCAALLHPMLGRPLRAAIGGGTAVIPSTKKRGGAGTAIDVPLHFKDDEWRFDSFDAMEVRVADAPAADEIVIVVAITSGARPLARIGSGRR